MPPLRDQPSVIEVGEEVTVTNPNLSNIAGASLSVVLPTDPETQNTSGISAMPATSSVTMTQPPPIVAAADNMPYTVTIDDIPPPKADFSAPPPYEMATKLPTYEEVQREKTLQGELPRPGPSSRTTMPVFLAIDADSSSDEGSENLLGTDFMFFIAFIVAFLFNWIGFLLLMCFCHTIAARYGALAGFGLSLAKWTLIVKQSTDFASRDNNWLWWLVMTFGLLICVRATLQYVNIKRGWRMLSGNAQERLLFFY